MSRRRKEEPEKVSILARLEEERLQSLDEEDPNTDVTVFFCGMKKCGKTSLIDRFINPSKDDKDDPKPTVALDYKFARYASETSSTKILADIYDLCEGMESLISIPMSPMTIGRLTVVVTVDLSEPSNALQALIKWLKLIRAQAMKSLDLWSKESAGAARRAEAKQNKAKEFYQNHPDKLQIKPLPVPLVIIGTKWDLFVAEADNEKRRSFTRALRYFAHVNGASLVFSSTKEKAASTVVRSVLRQLLFNVPLRNGIEQFDIAKPLCVLAGKDTLQSIGSPLGGGDKDRVSDQAWLDLINQLYPLSPGERSTKLQNDCLAVGEELLGYAEPAIDGMVEQRREELQLYRRQAERNQRLASEGFDSAKLSAAFAG